MRDVDIVTDGTTVWVNASDGMCIGRFGPRGIDIHQDTRGQLAGEHCLFCRKSADPLAKRGTRSDWLLFVEKMRALHGVEISKDVAVILQ